MHVYVCDISDNYLKLNASKCCYMKFSKKRSPSYPDTSLYINENCPLLKVDKFKYLGVTITSCRPKLGQPCSYDLQQS